MKNIRLDLSYDGTNYSGWQIQPNGITIEEKLKEALLQSNITAQHLLASGRTDAGVHANNQVVSFLTDSTVPPDRITFALNRYLPEDIRILKSSEVPKSFSAHYSAIGKKYSYYINQNSISSPIASRYSWHFPYKLDQDRLIKASKLLTGEHDYINFMSSGSNIKTTVRNLNLIKPIFLADNFLRLDYIGNGFLYNMVRILTGTIIQFANNQLSEERLNSVFDRKDRNLAGITAPAQGLFLEKVFYSENEKTAELNEKS